MRNENHATPPVVDQVWEATGQNVHAIHPVGPGKPSLLSYVGTFIDDDAASKAADDHNAILERRFRQGFAAAHKPIPLVERLRAWPATFDLGDAFDSRFVGGLMEEAAAAIEGKASGAVAFADEIDTFPRPAPGDTLISLAEPLTRQSLVKGPTKEHDKHGLTPYDRGRQAIIASLISALRSRQLTFLGPYRDGYEDGGAAQFPDRFEIEGTIDLNELINAFALAASGLPDVAERLQIAEAECAALAESNTKLRALLNRDYRGPRYSYVLAHNTSDGP